MIAAVRGPGGDQAIDRRRQFAQRANVGDRLLGDGKAELVFELEQELEESQRVDPKLVDLGTFVDGVRLAAELLCGELLDGGECIHDWGRENRWGRPLRPQCVIRLHRTPVHDNDAYVPAMSVFARQPGWMLVVLTVGATLRADHAAHAQVTPAGL